MSSQFRASLGRVSVATITWFGCVIVGWSLLAVTVWQLPSWAAQVALGPFVTMAILTVATSLLPVSLTTLGGSPAYGWWAFAFAALYVWGLAPALLLAALGVFVSQVQRRKTLDAALFNIGMYLMCVAAAWLVLRVADTVTVGIDGLWAASVAWMVASWAVFIVVNVALVAGLASWDGQTWWEYFTEDLSAHVLAMLSMLALSPLVAVAAVGTDRSWLALLLLLVPLFAVRKVADSSRTQEHLALHDPLTGLANRALINDRIDQSLARGSRHESEVLLLFIDLDHFKAINDTFGHQCGDDLLKSVAERVQQVVRPSDTFGRYAGDEFVLLCEEIPGSEIDALVVRISQALREPHRLAGRDVVCTASIGFAVADESSTAQSLIAAADAAMYRAKSSGRDSTVKHE